MMRGSRRGLWLLASGAVVGAIAAPAPAAAQTPPGAVVQPLGPDSGAELRRHLNTLADNPRSLSALTGAGRAALDAGDAQAAFSFFARADEISPRDARVKAGMATALVQLEQPQAALRLFGEAAGLGAPEGEIAGDRGLAYDMLGDPRRAQQDYTLALRQRENAEIRRRLALSLAISGQRDAALRLIDDQLRRSDRAARRTQAFVLALTGDVTGANRAAQAAMPAGTAQAMAPFLARLAGLSPGQKAMAVHFGHFPSDGRAMASSADTRPDPGALALAGGGAPQPAPPRAQPSQVPEPVSRAPRRRPGPGEASAERIGSEARPSLPSRRRESEPAPASQQRQPVQVAQLETRRAEPPAAQPQPRPQPSQPSPNRFQAAPEPAPARIDPPVAEPAQPPPVPTTTTGAAQQPSSIVTTTIPPSQEPPQPVSQPAETTRPGFSLSPQGAQPTVPPRSEPPPTAASTPLADIASVVNSLREEPVPATAPPRRPAPTPAPTQRPAQTAANATRPRARAAQPANPSRHWVQIAGGADRTSLPREFARLRALAPQQLGNRAAYTAPLRATNRLLVGPFPSTEDAQLFVNALAQRNVAAFAWTSPAGQEIERLEGLRR